ncbi:MAG: phosphopyruvate hydratase, partial [Candidatus Levyibacteriota bacterium]
GGPAESVFIDFQEVLVIPASSKSYKESLQIMYTIFHMLKDQLKESNFSTLTSSQGAFSPQATSNTDCLTLLANAINGTSSKLGFDVFLGLDVAANNLYHNQEYRIRDKAMGFSAKNFLTFLADLMKQFDILYFEDVLSEDDWSGWENATTTLSKNSIIVGDDLVATNPYRLQMAIDKSAVNGIVIKPNLAGTVIESLAIAQVAKSSGLKVVVSQRGIETNDDFIADFAIACGADYIKCGGLTRGEHVAKYNRLLQIEEHLQKLKH